jgi:hypothetical protein
VLKVAALRVELVNVGVLAAGQGLGVGDGVKDVTECRFQMPLP